MGERNFKPPCKKRTTYRCKKAPISCKYVNKSRKYCRTRKNHKKNRSKFF